MYHIWNIIPSYSHKFQIRLFRPSLFFFAISPVLVGVVLYWCYGVMIKIGFNLVLLSEPIFFQRDSWELSLINFITSFMNDPYLYLYDFSSFITLSYYYHFSVPLNTHTWNRSLVLYLVLLYFNLCNLCYKTFGKWKMKGEAVTCSIREGKKKKVKLNFRFLLLNIILWLYENEENFGSRLRKELFL